MNRRLFLKASALLAAGCSDSGTRTESDASTANEPQSWEEILAAGRQEGRVLMYGGVLGAAHVNVIANAFKKSTGIDFDFLPITGSAALTRIREEAKVGRAPDIFDATGGWLRQLDADNMLVALKDKPLPIWSEPHTVWQVHPGYKAPDWHYVLSRLRVRQGHVGVNTKLLAEKDFPTSWNDLATNPKFKGKMVLVDPSKSTSASAELVIQGYIGKKMTARDLWGIETGQDPMLISVPRANVISVARGERAMTFPPLDETALNMIEAGAPVKNIYFPDTPIFAETAEMGVINSGAHRNAAMVFINWFLSREGQQVLGEILLQTSVRRDVASTVPAVLKGEVVGGGQRGPIIVDRPIQTKLIQDLLAAGLTKKLVDGSTADDFEKTWTAFINEWEATHGGPQDTPMVVEFE